MRNINHILLIAGILAALLLAGCDGLSRNRDRPFETDFHVGTKGVEMGFTKDNPPSTVAKGDEFLVEVWMRNSGAYDIEDGLVEIINVFPGYFSFPGARTYLFDLDGRAFGNREGEYKSQPFQVESTGMPEGVTRQTLWMTARVCYPYQTKASINVCIDPNANNPLIISSPGCKVEDVVARAGQGAPVAITVVETRLLKTGERDLQMQFLLHIENAGRGKVTARERFRNECEDRTVDASDFANIDYEVRISNLDITDNCRRPVIDANNPDELLLLCAYSLEPDRGSYTTPLIVTLDYGYVTEDIKRKIIVEDLPYGSFATCEIERCQPKSLRGDECDAYGGINEEGACLSPAMTCCNNIVAGDI